MTNLVNHIPIKAKPNIHKNIAAHKNHDKPIQKTLGFGFDVPSFGCRMTRLKIALTPQKLPTLKIAPIIKPIKIPTNLSAFQPDSKLHKSGVVTERRQVSS